jgi:DnaK suppressor protein
MKSRHLTPSEIERFKAALRTKRRELARTVTEMESGSLLAEKPEEPKVPSHPADRGTDSSELDKAVQLLQTESRLLEEIDRALDLIEEGAYGQCEACHETIAVKRLEAAPWARLCLACANAAERAEPLPKRAAWLRRRHTW